MKIYITGHKSPDLDSVVSAVAYAELLQKSKKYPQAEVVPLIGGQPNNETLHVFEKFDVKIPQSVDQISPQESDAFILVDHNEQTQRPDQTKNANIVELVDHHKANVNFGTLLQINIMPLGSTSSIVYDLFIKAGIKPSKKTNQLLLAAILSDTQGLRSSTTTGIDSDHAHQLAQQLDLDLNNLTFDIFKAKSDITGLSNHQIVKRDYKVFKFGEVEVFVNQVETVEPQKILSKKDDLIDTLEEVKTELRASIGYIIVTDILNVNSQVIYSNDEEKRILEKAFTAEGEDGIVDIGPRTSRKKDIVPQLEKIIMEEEK
jgi:manganese-dependent inorganic pyrophosphatase